MTQTARNHGLKKNNKLPGALSAGAELPPIHPIYRETTPAATFKRGNNRWRDVVEANRDESDVPKGD